MKNLNCLANPCPILLNATCVFYTGVNLLYTGITTNDNLQTALEKIDLTLENISLGSGSQNYVAKWGSTSTLSDSIIYDDGLGVMVNTTTNNSYKFDVNGSARVQTNLVVGPINSILADINYALRVNTPLAGAINAFGVFSDGETQSSVTSNAHYFRSVAKTVATSFTLDSVNHFSATQGTFGLGSTVTNQYGFRAWFSLTGATNNYGFHGDIAAATNNWNLYMNGTAKNYLAGNTLIGTTSDDGVNKLQVTGNIKASQYRLSALNTAPTSATATGTLGEIRIDANFIYICVATNTWKRSAISTWP